MKLIKKAIKKIKPTLDRSYIRFYNINTNLDVYNKIKLKKVIKGIGSEAGRRVRLISIILCDNQYIKRINTDYLSHEYPTDVITFDLSSGDYLESDIFIGAEVVQENAKLYNCSIQYELERVIIHGVLHLCGFDDHDEDERKLMRQAEDKWLYILHKEVT